jgi:hypothetical protein
MSINSATRLSDVPRQERPVHSSHQVSALACIEELDRIATSPPTQDTQQTPGVVHDRDLVDAVEVAVANAVTDGHSCHRGVVAAGLTAFVRDFVADHELLVGADGRHANVSMLLDLNGGLRREQSIPWLTAMLAAALEGLGPQGTIEGKRLRLLRFSWNDGPSLWRPWTSPGSGLPIPALEAVAKALWHDRYEPRLNAPQFKVPGVEQPTGDVYVRGPKVTAGISWALGTSGQRKVEIDGDDYCAAPSVTRYVSRSLGILPSGKRPSQISLPVYRRAERRDLVVQAVTDTQFVLRPSAARALLFALVTAPSDGSQVLGTVGDLERVMYPEQRSRRRQRDAIIEGFRDLRWLGVLMPDGTDFLLLDIQAPQAGTIDRDTVIHWGWTHSAIRNDRGGVLRPWRGEFLLNLTGAMRLTGNQTLELRTYLHAAASWNEARRGLSGRLYTHFIPEMTLEDLGARVNALSLPTVQYLRERNGRRQSVSDDRRRLKQALEALEGDDLINLEFKGPPTRRRWQLLPPVALQTAYRAIRSGGAADD